MTQIKGVEQSKKVINDTVKRIVGELARELHPKRVHAPDVGIDSSLDRDLGFDSLARVELIYRLERAFGVDLPDALLGEADNVGDLVAAVGDGGAQPQAIDRSVAATASLTRTDDVPDTARTLVEVLSWHAERHSDRTHLVISRTVGDETVITFAALATRARQSAMGLRQLGLEAGDRVAIMLPTEPAFFVAFMAVLLAGGVPVPIYPPARRSQIEEHMRRQARILENAGARILISTAEARALAVLLRTLVPELQKVASVDELLSAPTAALPKYGESNRTALIQYTSGSTGDPKGVILSHRNLLANIRAMGERMSASSADVFVSWLPLYHDMGLIGAWLGCMYYAVPTVIMPPTSFLARPERWLWAIHRHRATLSAAPNFAFELCLSKIQDSRLEGLDLSSLRFVANGAEPVSADTIRRFTTHFKRYGFRSSAMAPVYGLAENAVGLAFPPMGRGPVIDKIDRAGLTQRGEARPANQAGKGTIELVACGQPLPDHEIRIIDSAGLELGERRQGRLQFRGPSSTSGYFRNEAKNADLFDEDWLDSGDLAYIAGGDVFVTGRVKDVIIRAGRNIYPQEIEEAVGKVPGVRKGCVAVFGVVATNSGVEKVVVIAETRENESSVREALEQQISEIVSDVVGLAPDVIRLVSPRMIPKTSSGKIRRTAARERFEAGALTERPRALPWQLAHLTLSGVGPQLMRWRTLLRDFLYAAWWWVALASIGAVVWPLTLLLPRLRWRWILVRCSARLFLRAVRVPIEVEGLKNLPASGCLLVANHASYVDGLVLASFLPGELAFVAKKELANQLVAGTFLRRLGTIFVERFEHEVSVTNVATILDRARDGSRIVLFPEGTFLRMPGLLPFHLGAFHVACSAGLAVVPIALSGTRSMLRGEQWFPRRAEISVTVCPAVGGKGQDFAEIIRLRDNVREAILSGCGEPDLEE